MQCIYYSAGECYATPNMQLPEMFTPDPKDTEKYCKTGEFKACPRYSFMQPTSSKEGSGTGGESGSGGSSKNLLQQTA